MILYLFVMYNYGEVILPERLSEIYKFYLYQTNVFIEDKLDNSVIAKLDMDLPVNQNLNNMTISEVLELNIGENIKDVSNLIIKDFRLDISNINSKLSEKLSPIFGFSGIEASRYINTIIKNTVDKVDLFEYNQNSTDIESDSNSNNNSNKIDFFKLLNVSYFSSENEIHSKYKKLISIFHPDKNDNEYKNEFGSIVNKLVLAHDILMKHDTRIIYYLFGEEMTNKYIHFKINLKITDIIEKFNQLSTFEKLYTSILIIIIIIVIFRLIITIFLFVRLILTVFRLLV